LLATRDAKGSWQAAARLVANMAFVDHALVPQANTIAAGLVSDGGEMFAILGVEIQTVVFLATRVIKAEFIERMLIAVEQGCVVTIPQHRLYERALATLACVVPEAADRVVPILAMLITRARVNEAERQRIIAEAPEWLAYEPGFDSVYLALDVAGIIGEAMQNCSPEVTEQMRTDFPGFFE
jgi:hypothetical protein